MSNIMVNAPIQNKQFSPDDQLGKIVPLFASQWLAHRSQEASDDMPKVAELWNNVLASEQVGHLPRSYATLTTARLEDKYRSKVMTSLHDRTGTPLVITDDDPDFLQWAHTKVETSIHNGDLRLKKLAVYVCGNCDASLAIGEGPCPSGCASCQHKEGIALMTRQVLVAKLSQGALAAVDLATGTVGVDWTNEGYFVVNKRRLNGVSLSTEGFKDDVVDPRISLGLLAMYAAEKTSADSVRVVASNSTVRQNLVHFFSAILSQQAELPRLQMVGIAKAPVDYLMHLRDQGYLDTPATVGVLYDRLIPHLLKMRKDMTPAHAERIIYSRRQTIDL